MLRNPSSRQVKGTNPFPLPTNSCLQKKLCATKVCNLTFPGKKLFSSFVKKSFPDKKVLLAQKVARNKSLQPNFSWQETFFTFRKNSSSTKSFACTKNCLQQKFAALPSLAENLLPTGQQSLAPIEANVRPEDARLFCTQLARKEITAKKSLAAYNFVGSKEFLYCGNAGRLMWLGATKGVDVEEGEVDPARVLVGSHFANDVTSKQVKTYGARLWRGVPFFVRDKNYCGKPVKQIWHEIKK